MSHFGSCLCGKVKYKIEGDFDHFYLCHCEKCRKDTGSAHAANLFSSTAKLEWLSGENNVKLYNHQMQGHIKAFCMTCGSALPNLQLDGKLLMVPAGSLDTNIALLPNAHIYYQERAAWDTGLDLVIKLNKGPE